MISRFNVALRRPRVAAATALAFALASFAAAPAFARDADDFRFDMVPSAAVVKAGCLADARAKVTIEPEGPVEVMKVKVEGLPANTDFDFFVIQVPNTPFGMAWYQGDIETNAKGVGHGRFIGRFSSETFIVAPGVAPAPSVHNNAFPDAIQNPATGPVHTFHLGLWFNSPADAVKAGCPGNVTPFNGEHDAGLQVLSTRNFPDLQGPLLSVKP
jgi:hypothetical protein